MALSLREAVDCAADRLKRADVETPKRDASLLLAHVLTSETSILYREPERQLTETEQEAFDALIERRARREPVSHLTGHREFWSLDFLVGSDVLDPRADSETLIEAVLSEVQEGFEVSRILDLGTGSGCLLLSLLSELPEATGVGVDVSEKALAIARRNAERLGLAQRAEFRHGRWHDGLEECFDIVISNPPYIPASDIKELQTEVREYEPHLALIGGEDGLDCYREIIAGLNAILRPGGLIVFEVGVGQALMIGEMLQKAGFIRAKYHKDLSGTSRCVSAFQGK
ncbi:MAG: peptide chain release factor N(5)-glutamine methyltransferase [Sneathiella sp.]|nr:peptide chain release factor N(5)-glutamine methyltransferase [Sneathiella sp.]